MLPATSSPLQVDAALEVILPVAT
jgi:hypothetical protein